MDISVAITTFNEGFYLDRLLKDLSAQSCGLSFEIVLVEAGGYDVLRARDCLGYLSERLVFLSRPNLSRTESLNLIFEIAKGDLIVRLDARSHVSRNYLEEIHQLSIESGAENVGGVMLPVGLDDYQATIAEIMKHPFAFGGAKSRKEAFRGFADSVYLGAFRKNKCKFGDEWFDSVHPKISEDSDLNYRIRRNGGKIFIDSSIVVQHYPRENLGKFFKLCFNYGVGRGLFVMKHRVFSAFRQLVPLCALLFALLLLFLGFSVPEAHFLLLSGVALYFSAIALLAFGVSKSTRYWAVSFFGFIGCHLFWTFGLLASPIVYKKDVFKKH